MNLWSEPIDGAAARDAVDAFLVAHRWPFHGTARLSAEGARRVALGPPESVRAFWILEAGERVGLLRVFDLEDTDDGSPMFDLRVAVQHRGRGIGRWAVAWMARTLFDDYPGLHRIEAATRFDNEAMRRVLESSGFVLEGRLRETWRGEDGTRFDTAIYGLLRHEAH